MRSTFQNSVTNWLLLPLTALLSGCASMAKVSEVNVQTNKSNTYLASEGTQLSQARIEKQLEEASKKRRERVFWAGVAIVGGKAESDSTMGFCGELLPEFNASLTAKLAGVKPQLFDLQNTGSGPALMDNLRDQDALALVIGLLSENTRAEPDPLLDGKIRGEVKITAQMLFLDTSKNLQIVATYPIGINQFGVFSSAPSRDQFLKIAREALMSAERTSDGKASSLQDQIVEQLQGRTIVPRAWREPVAVESVNFTPACQAASSISRSVLKKWEDDFACAFVNYLGMGSGLAVNPYISGGGTRPIHDRALSAAGSLTMRTAERKMLDVPLKAPRIVFRLRFDDMRRVVNPRSTDFLKILNYGFSGELRVVNCDTGVELLTAPVEVPVGQTGNLPPALCARYDKISAVKFLPETLRLGFIDHAFYWQESIDAYLLQLCREILYGEEDLAGRFGAVREELNRSLNGMDRSSPTGRLAKQ